MAISGYVNPLSGIANLVEERIDQGVDFSGSGPIKAIGDAKILVTSEAGWPGGGYMAYQLTSGPASGKVVYVAEDITPTVSVGQNVTAGQTIANMFQGGSGIETGWATPDGLSPVSQTAAAGSISGSNLPGGGSNPTAIGLNFDQLLQALGVKAAPNAGGTVGGTLPSGYPDWLKSVAGGASATLASDTSGIGGVFTFPEQIIGFFKDADTFVSKLLWLAEPSTWLRIGAFFIGGILLIAALIIFTKADQKVGSIPVPMPVPV